MFEYKTVFKLENDQRMISCTTCPMGKVEIEGLKYCKAFNIETSDIMIPDGCHMTERCIITCRNTDCNDFDENEPNNCQEFINLFGCSKWK